MKSSLIRSCRVLGISAAVFSLSACSLQVFCPKPGERANADSQDAYVHTVRHRGETLSHISQWYTGSWRNWRRIQAHNPSLEVRRMRLGQRIEIPGDLVKRSTPFEFAAAAKKDGTKPLRIAASTPAAPEETGVKTGVKSADTKVTAKAQDAAPASATIKRARLQASPSQNSPEPKQEGVSETHRNGTLLIPEELTIPEEIARLKEATIAAKIERRPNPDFELSLPAPEGSSAAPAQGGTTVAIPVKEAPVTKATVEEPQPQQQSATKEPVQTQTSLTGKAAATTTAVDVGAGATVSPAREERKKSRIAEKGPAQKGTAQKGTAQKRAADEAELGTLFSCQADNCTLKVLD